MLGHGRQDMQRQPGRIRIVARDEVDPTLHEVGDKGEVAAQSIEARDDQRRAPPPRHIERAREFGPIGALARFDLGEGRHDLTPGALDVPTHALGLSVQPKPGSALAVG